MSLRGRLSRLEQRDAKRLTPSVCFLDRLGDGSERLTVTELWLTDPHGRVQRHKPQGDSPPDLTRYGPVKVIIGVPPDAL